MRLAVLASVTVVIVACTSGGGDPTGTGTSSGASSADGGGSSSGGGSSGTTSGSSSGGMSSSGDGGSFAERGCQGAVSLTSLVKYGQTSSCSHPVPVTYDPNMINVYYSPSPGVTERLCQTSRTSCDARWIVQASD